MAQTFATFDLGGDYFPDFGFAKPATCTNAVYLFFFIEVDDEHSLYKIEVIGFDLDEETNSFTTVGFASEWQ